eukprot:UN27195
MNLFISTNIFPRESCHQNFLRIKSVGHYTKKVFLEFSFTNLFKCSSKSLKEFLNSFVKSPPV